MAPSYLVLGAPRRLCAQIGGMAPSYSPYRFSLR